MPLVHSKPEFSDSQVTEMMKRLFDLTLSKMQPLPSYDDQNVHVVTDDGVDYVLKIMNSEDSKNFSLIDVQTYIMSFLRQNGLPTQSVVPMTSGKLLSLEEVGRNRLCCRGKHEPKSLKTVHLVDYFTGLNVFEIKNVCKVSL